MHVSVAIHCAQVMVDEKPSPAYLHHCYMPYGNPEAGVANQIALYGIPTTLDDFCRQVKPPDVLLSLALRLLEGPHV
jgi:hypothetical protein